MSGLLPEPETEPTRLRTQLLGRRLLNMIPHIRVPTAESSDALLVDDLTVQSKSRLLALGGAPLLLAEHDMDFFLLQVLAEIPLGEAIFILFFSDIGV